MSTKAIASHADHIISGEKSPFEKFRALTKKVMSVPKSKIDAREVKYRSGRKNKNRKRHR